MTVCRPQRNVYELGLTRTTWPALPRSALGQPIRQGVTLGSQYYLVADRDRALIRGGTDVLRHRAHGIATEVIAIRPYNSISPLYHHIVVYLPIHPPSTVNTSPETYRLALLARYTIEPLKSSGLPHRPAGIRARILAANFSSLVSSSVISV